MFCFFVSFVSSLYCSHLGGISSLCEHACVWSMCLCRGQRSTLVSCSVTLCLSPSRQGLLLNLELACGPASPSSLLPLPLQDWAYKHAWPCPAVSISAEDLNLQQVFLHAEPSRHPGSYFLIISLSPTPLKAICRAHICFFAHHWAESLTGLGDSQVTLPVLDLQKKKTDHPVKKDFKSPV